MDRYFGAVRGLLLQKQTKKRVDCAGQAMHLETAVAVHAFNATLSAVQSSGRTYRVHEYQRLD